MSFKHSQIRGILRKILPEKILALARKLIYPEKIFVLEDEMGRLFKSIYRDISATDLDQKKRLSNSEFKIFSKHGADGILAFIFSKIGVTDNTFIEIGIESGRECNTANLSLNFGWRGLLVEANKDWADSARKFYDEKLGAHSNKVKVVNCIVSAENVDKLLKDNGMSGEVDLLSIDIDGNDYWVWDKISSVKPRVVVIEYNAAFGNRSATIKYNPSHHYWEIHKNNPLYFGASLAALSKLARVKGYSLVGCDTHGHDAFFVRSDVAKGKFVDLSPEQAFYHNPYTLKTFGSTDEQFNTIKDLELEYI